MNRAIREYTDLLDELISITTDYLTFEGTVIEEFQSDSIRISNVIPLSDGRVLYNELEAPVINMWDPFTNMQTSGDAPDIIRSLIAMPRDVAISVGNAVTTWDLETLSVLHSWQGEEEEFLGGINFGSQALIWDSGHFYFYNPYTQQHYSVEINGYVRKIIRLSEYRFAVLTDDIEIWDGHTLIKTLPDQSTDILVCGEYLVSSNNTTIKIWDGDYELIDTLNTEEFKLLTAVGNHRLVWVTENYRLNIYNIISRRYTLTETPFIRPEMTDLHQPDYISALIEFRGFIVTGHTSGNIRTWDLHSGRVDRILGHYNIPFRTPIEHLVSLEDQLLSIDKNSNFRLWI